ncbi:hypothetical protein ACFOSD_11960 [Salinispirillum marinum]|uniref:Uncharacterized protein n=2 Tax=Saccharospirillaceae TaxID=255527 RepID=A0ABV8BJ22_9GAMM
MSEAYAIEATGLTKHFGPTRAVNGIDLKVRKGSVYGILGPNGASWISPHPLLSPPISCFWMKPPPYCSPRSLMTPRVPSRRWQD